MLDGVVSYRGLQCSKADRRTDRCRLNTSESPPMNGGSTSKNRSPHRRSYPPWCFLASTTSSYHEHVQPLYDRARPIAPQTSPPPGSSSGPTSTSVVVPLDRSFLPYSVLRYFYCYFWPSVSSFFSRLSLPHRFPASTHSLRSALNSLAGIQSLVTTSDQPSDRTVLVWLLLLFLEDPPCSIPAFHHRSSPCTTVPKQRDNNT